MKNRTIQLLGSGAMLAAVLSFTAVASADSINLGSFGTGQLISGDSNTAMTYDGFTCPGGASSCPAVDLNYATDFSGAPPSTINVTNPTPLGNTYDVQSNGVWTPAVQGSSWVSLASNAGPGVGGADPGDNPTDGYYEYSTTFDSASGGQWSGYLSVMADDTTYVYLNGLQVLPAGALGTNTECAQNEPDCVTADTIAWDPTLLVGLNTLTFVVEQTGQDAADNPTGVDFDAVLTPEPSGLLLLGTGLLGLAFLLFRRNANANPTAINPTISA